MNLYQSFLGDDQRSFLSPRSVPLDVQGNTRKDQREYELLKRIWRTSESAQVNAWGLISWKFEHKTRVPVAVFADFCQEKLAAGYDAAFINPVVGNEAMYINVWEQGSDMHPGMGKLANFLGQNLSPQSVLAPMGQSTFALCDYVVATPRFWSGYFGFVDRVLALLDQECANGTEVGKAYLGGAHYLRDASLNLRVFVIERLLSSFIVSQPALRVAAFDMPLSHYQKKFGDLLGQFLHELSALKSRALKAQDQSLFQTWDQLRRTELHGALKAVVWQLDDPAAFFLSPAYADFQRLVNT